MGFYSVKIANTQSDNIASNNKAITLKSNVAELLLHVYTSPIYNMNIFLLEYYEPASVKLVVIATDIFYVQLLRLPSDAFAIWMEAYVAE